MILWPSSMGWADEESVDVPADLIQYLSGEFVSQVPTNISEEFGPEFGDTIVGESPSGPSLDWLSALDCSDPDFEAQHFNPSGRSTPLPDPCTDVDGKNFYPNPMYQIGYGLPPQPIEYPTPAFDSNCWGDSDYAEHGSVSPPYLPTSPMPPLSPVTPLAESTLTVYGSPYPPTQSAEMSFVYHNFVEPQFGTPQAARTQSVPAATPQDQQLLNVVSAAQFQWYGTHSMQSLAALPQFNGANYNVMSLGGNHDWVILTRGPPCEAYVCNGQQQQQ